MRVIIVALIWGGPCLPGQAQTADDTYFQAGRDITNIQWSIEKYQGLVDSASSPYQRLKAQRALEEARRQLQRAKDTQGEALLDAGLGSKAFQDQVSQEGRTMIPIERPEGPKSPGEDEYRYEVGAPSVGPGQSVDPMRGAVLSGKGISGPGLQYGVPARIGSRSSGGSGQARARKAPAILYNAPAGFNNASYSRGATRDRYKSRETASASSGALAGFPARNGGDNGRPIFSGKGVKRFASPLDAAMPQEIHFVREDDPLAFPQILSEPAKAGDDALRRVRALKDKVAAGEYDDALDEADALVAGYPADPGVFHMRALVLNRIGRYAEAERMALRALRIRPESASLLRTLAWSRLKQGKFSAALKSIERALAIDPDSADARMIRAIAYDRLGKRERMMRDVIQAAALKPRRYGRWARQAKLQGSLLAPSPADSVGLYEEAAQVGGGRSGFIFGGLALLGAAGGVLVLAWRRSKASVNSR